MTGFNSKKNQIKKLEVSAYKVPTKTPESDGTFEWDSTTMVLVTLEAAGEKGIGYTYADVSAATLIDSTLRNLVIGENPLDVEKIFQKIHKSIRNNGNCGIAFMALSAIDVALWDLKSKLFGVPLCTLLGQTSESILLYGSGGFTSYTDEQLAEQLGEWSGQGFSQVKMKIGREPEKDVQRIRVARDSINPETSLFVDANGAYSVKQAVKMAQEFEKYDVRWYEEPVSSDNLQGLHLIRENSPAGINIAAGEYGFDISYFRNMLTNGVVDVLQADATRCGGITGFLKAGVLAEAFQVPFSFHCAPSVHLHAALSLPAFYTGEYFYDHSRIEQLFFDGFRQPKNGKLSPDLSRSGLGLEFKTTNAEKYMIFHDY